MKKTKFLFAIALVALIYSCKTPTDLTYFQDTAKGTLTGVAEPKELTVAPNDRLYINVHSRDEDLTKAFQLYTSNYGYQSNNQNYGGYVVDSDGSIDFPELGRIDVAGKTRETIAKEIKSRLMAEDLVRDPVVTVSFAEQWVDVLGQVGSPGRKQITKQGETLLDIIADAGDVQLSGIRTNIKVMRLENGQYHTYVVDLTNATNVMTSPVYYVQPKDIVYVEPNDVTKRSTTPNGNTLLTPAFWMSAASFTIGIASLVVTLISK